MLEVRWHGRGGHGLLVASHLLGEIAITKGLYSLSIPLFGAERRGAPVTVVTRIDNKPIFKRSLDTSPDILIVTDKRLIDMIDVKRGVKDGGLVVINTDKLDDHLKKYFRGLKIAYVNAVNISSRLGLRLGGLPLVNIPLLGALIKAIKLVDKKTAMRILREHWGGELGRKNAEVFRIAYEVTKIVS